MNRELKIGIFAVAIICCSWAGIRFLSGIDIFGRNVEYYASYDKINGISSASTIFLQGVKIGSVTDIYLDPASSDKVTLKFSIKRRYKIPSNSTARIYSPGLMSSMAIGLTWGDSPTFLERGDTITTDFEVSMMDLAAEKLMGLADNLSKVSQELNTTLGNVNSLLENSSSNVEQSLENLNAISSEISELLTSQSSNIESAVEGIAQLSSSLGNKSGDIEQIISSLSSLSSELSEAKLGEGLAATLEQLNTTLSKINSAEGSAGKLLSDEQLYENLAAVSGSLSSLIVDMQENPKRYVHFSLFGAKEKSE